MIFTKSWAKFLPSLPNRPTNVLASLSTRRGIDGEVRDAIRIAALLLLTHKKFATKTQRREAAEVLVRHCLTASGFALQCFSVSVAILLVNVRSFLTFSKITLKHDDSSFMPSILTFEF